MHPYLARFICREVVYGLEFSTKFRGAAREGLIIGGKKKTKCRGRSQRVHFYVKKGKILKLKVLDLYSNVGNNE